MRRILKFLFKLIPAVEVHGWGGFGSQLFAVVVARRIVQKFPQRRVRLCLHSSGVTHRSVELPEELMVSFELKAIDDFTDSSNTDFEFLIPLRKKLSRYVRSMLVQLLEYLGFLSRLETQKQFSKIRPWLISVRGHYTGIKLSTEEIEWLLKSLCLNNSNTHHRISTALHFRLGDLLVLKNQSYVSPSDLRTVIESIPQHGIVEIYSDSPAKILERIIQPFFLGVSFKVLHCTPLETIRQCLQAQYFVGTNSKVSIWIAVFRNHLYIDRDNYLPKSIFEQFELLVAHQSKPSRTSLY